MISKNLNETVDPKKQLSIYGYKDYLDFFIKIYQKNKLPNVILLNGPKGIGKATFAYHFINYLFSSNELNTYSIDKCEINPENKSYRLLNNGIHPNFFLLENSSSSENIKIETVRNLLLFLNKTSYLKNIKIVLIDNAEYLNISSSNALLKALEEPSQNTYYFITYSSSAKILETIKSRTIQFNFFLNSLKKKEIFDKLLNQYSLNCDINIIEDKLYFDTPGNLIKNLLLLNDENIDFSSNDLTVISYLINKYNNKKNSELLNTLSKYIEHFFNKLSLEGSDNINRFFFKKNKIISEINQMKKFNLDRKNILNFLPAELKNEIK